MHKTYRGVGLVICLAMSQVASQAAPLPDATTLLQGVESARLQIPPSRLRMLAVYRSAINTAEPELLVQLMVIGGIMPNRELVL